MGELLAKEIDSSGWNCTAIGMGMGDALGLLAGFPPDAFALCACLRFWNQFQTYTAKTHHNFIILLDQYSHHHRSGLNCYLLGLHSNLSSSFCRWTSRQTNLWLFQVKNNEKKYIWLNGIWHVPKLLGKGTHDIARRYCIVGFL